MMSRQEKTAMKIAEDLLCEEDYEQSMAGRSRLVFGTGRNICSPYKPICTAQV